VANRAALQGLISLAESLGEIGEFFNPEVHHLGRNVETSQHGTARLLPELLKN